MGIYFGDSGSVSQSMDNRDLDSEKERLNNEFSRQLGISPQYPGFSKIHQQFSGYSEHRPYEPNGWMDGWMDELTDGPTDWFRSPLSSTSLPPRQLNQSESRLNKPGPLPNPA